MRLRRFAACTWMCVMSLAAAHAQVQLGFDGGTLKLTPLDERSVRIQFTGGEEVTEGLIPEWIYTGQDRDVHTRVRTAENGTTLMSTSLMSVEADPAAGTVTVRNAEGECVFRATGHSLEPAPLDGHALYRATLTADSPEGEALFGLGQFQDGYLDVRGLTRRLTQVNTQISIPMYISSMGYGLLWNNYGLVDFNPSEHSVALLRQEGVSESEVVDVTSSTGGTKEVRTRNLFEAEIEIEESGRYALLLDVGQKMARRHNLSIDGRNIIDVRNLWLPPTVSAIVELEKGTHRVSAELERSDAPVLGWRRVDGSTVLSSPVAECVDYTVFVGNADEVTASYRQLTGEVPMIPEWALGYIHCRERYHNQAELLENAAEFRRRGIPIDMIVQDWQYWGDLGWNAMDFDRKNYPDPRAMTDSLHSMDMRLMLSVWSKIDRNSTVGSSMASKGFLIPGTDWVDFFNPAASDEYWRNFNSRLLPYGIDCWWQDATEPENDDLAGRRIDAGKYPGELLRNSYSLLVSKTVYEGLRRDDPSHRQLIFTRCGFPGIQRYGTATWSGDVGHDFKTLAYQLSAGLGMMASGQAWWTYDAGGFFRPRDQYDNPEYIETMLRWIQASVFLPMMRVHGYMSDTEPWRYGEHALEVVTDNIRLRYRLLPYIYSEASRVSFESRTMMRPLVFDFPADTDALSQKTEYMFGDAFLVCPVTEAGVTQAECYLPEWEAGWYELHGGRHHDGGRSVSVAVDDSFIPVFVRAGSIVPTGRDIQHSGEDTGGYLKVLVYPGADASFTLYEDDGTSMDYLDGEQLRIPLEWDDDSRTLTIGRSEGGYDGMPAVRQIDVCVDGDTRSVTYSGRKIRLKF